MKPDNTIKEKEPEKVETFMDIMKLNQGAFAGIITDDDDDLDSYKKKEREFYETSCKNCWFSRENSNGKIDCLDKKQRIHDPFIVALGCESYKKE